MKPVRTDLLILEALSRRFRSRRDVALRAFIDQARSKTVGPFRILDLGGRVSYWQRVGLDWLRDRDVSIVIANLSTNEIGSVSDGADVLCHVVGDATSMVDYCDGSFNLVHSNSVIEHVGRWQEMKCFANEVRRLAPSYYVQTPYFWFPIDPHYHRLPLYHWLPESVRTSLHQRFRLGHADRAPDLDTAMRLVHSSVLLDRSQFRALFPDAKQKTETLLGLPKSLIAMRAA